MQNIGGEHTGRFQVMCCKQRRWQIDTSSGAVRTGVLVCWACDGIADPERLTEVPDSLQSLTPGTC